LQATRANFCLIKTTIVVSDERASSIDGRPLEQSSVLARELALDRRQRRGRLIRRGSGSQNH
jgi:hypothetical protein